MSLVVVVEGDTDIPVVSALAASTGWTVATWLDMAGKDRLDECVRDFNRAARSNPWFVLRDLDQDAECAPTFVKASGLRPSRFMVFRLAVRQVEAWLLADAAALASFLHVPERRLPRDPDAEEDPTRTLVQLARRSTRRSIHRGMVPRAGFSAQVGPEYEAMLIEFATNHWSLERACARSPSLARARRALRELAGRWAEHARGTH